MTKNIYTIINVIAIAAIILMGVDTFYRFLEAGLEQPKPEKTAVRTQPNKSKRIRIERESAYDIIDRRSIFGKVAGDNSDSAGEVPDLENLESTTLNITLLGTSVVDRENSSAIISVKSKQPPEGVYYIGDSVEGALIKNIYRNKVVLSVNGKDEILQKEDTSTQTGNASPSSIMPPVPQTASVPTRTIPLKRDDVEAALSDLQTLSQASIKPHFADGEPDGLAITGIKSGSIFRRMGLRNGDIVKSVQGNEIKSTEDLKSLYNDLQSEDTVSLKIIRRGREQDIDLNFR